MPNVESEGAYQDKGFIIRREIIHKPQLFKELEAALPEWHVPHLVAHRGNGKFAPGQIRLRPENTIPAFENLHELGWSSFETDAAANVLCPLVRSGQEPPTIAIIHSDDPLQRTTKGQGSPFYRSREYLLDLDAGTFHSLEFAGLSVPTLEDVIQIAKEHKLLPIIEEKVPSPYPHKKEILEVSQEIGTVIARSMDGLYGDNEILPPLLSFSDAALQASGEAAARFPLVRNIRWSEGLNTAMWPSWSKRLKELGCIAIDPDHRLLTKELVELAHKDGFRVMTFLSNDSGGLTPIPGEERIDEVERIKELNSWGVDSIITDLVHRVVPG